MNNPVIHTTAGPVRGLATSYGAVFHSIPYAVASPGIGRFAPPAPADPWDGIRDATQPGATAPQPRRETFGTLDLRPFFGPGWVRGADYLTVNVHTPLNQDQRAPVMVFVHGGGFIAGSPRAPLYSGESFARDGVVLVTVGYRLGVTGFLDLPDAPRNRGLLDVLAALRWVHDNIEAFGGDPDAVTVFGQSAGAILLGALLADERSAGLTHQAILQSGSGTGAFSPEQAQRITEAAASALGVAPTAAAFGEVDDERLVGVLAEIAGLDVTTATERHPLGGIVPLGLVLEEQSAAGIARGLSSDVALMVGCTSEEGALYLAPTGGLADVSEKDLLDTAALFDSDPAAAVSRARQAKPGATDAELRTALMSDGLFRDGTRRTAEAHAPASAPTFAYEFSWRSDALGGSLGACHTVELPFVFGTTHLPALHGPNALLGTSPLPEALSTTTHEAWVRFAKTGDPGWRPFSPVDPHVQNIA
jgi:para-nitrobenzyl esterase